MVATMSPGLHEPPSGMFSQVATTARRLIGSRALAAATKVPITLAAPHISYFISSMPSPGLSEMPPLSKVNPLPTSTTGAAAASAAPCQLSSSSLGSCTLPLATDQKDGMFSRM